MSSFDSHSLTLQKIILVFKRLHAPLNSVIGKRGWKYNILQAKLHISHYSVRRAGTLSHIHNFFPILNKHLISGSWQDLALPCRVGRCLRGLWSMFQAQSQGGKEFNVCRTNAFPICREEVSTRRCPQASKVTKTAVVRTAPTYRMVPQSSERNGCEKGTSHLTLRVYGVGACTWYPQESGFALKSLMLRWRSSSQI